MILTIKDNIINSKEEMICHQVNCKGVMGKGVALAIKNKYRYAYTQYKAFCKNKEVKDLIDIVGDAVTDINDSIKKDKKES